MHFPVNTIPGGKYMKNQEERKPITEEAVDPKPPVIQSGRMEKHRF